jgi:tetratricopeptide (TPR) repeat protein
MKAFSRLVATLGVAAGLAAPGYAEPMTDEQVRLCVNEARAVSVDQQIFACTSAIVSGKWNGKSLSWAYVNRVMAYALKGNLDKALADANEAIRLDPGNAMAFTNRGFVYEFNDDPTRALADFNEAIRLDPSNALALNNRGEIYAERGEYTSAIQNYSEAIRIQPEFPAALTNRARVYFATGALDQALDDYSHTIKLEQNDAGTWTNRGTVYLAKGERDSAIADFGEAIRLDPRSVSAFSNRGNAYLGKRDYERAIADYEKALAIDGSEPGLYFNRGRANYFRGALHDAVRDFNRSLELDPTSAYAFLWQEIANMRSGRPSRLGQAGKQIDMTQWPAPVVRLYLREIAPEDVRGAAEGPDERLKGARLCEADFFLGELALNQAKKSEAKPYFQKALNECQASSLTFAGAMTEFKALEQSP